MLEFLDWAGRTGEMNLSTARAWAASARRVLAVEGDPATVNLRELDVESLLNRFETLNRTKYTSGSMRTYRSRFRQAVDSYLAWLQNESWQPAKRQRRAAASTAGSQRRAKPWRHLWSKLFLPLSTAPAHGW